MFDITLVKAAYKNLIGWRKHFDNCIDVTAENQKSDSGDYYQDKHPALRLDYVLASLSNKQDLNKYLAEKVEVATVNLFKDFIQKRQLSNYGKTLLQQAQLLNRPSFVNDKIINLGRFCGFQIHVKDATGLQIVLDEIGLQLDGAQTVTLHLFHSTVKDAIATFQMTTTNPYGTWKKVSENLNSMESQKFFGGVFILGYYQNTLTTQAVNYSNFDWNKGEVSCAGCGTSYYESWRSIGNHFHIYPVYWAEGNYTVGEMPDLSLASYDKSVSYGLNLKLTVRCDLTFFFIQNRFVFQDLLAYNVALVILKDMQFSTEINWVKEQYVNMVIRELEGDKETNALNLPQRYRNELKAVEFNTSDMNKTCLGCVDDVSQPTVGTL